MYNNLLEADGESYVWDENNLLFRNRETEIRDRLGSPIDMGEFGTETAASASASASALGFTGYMYDDISGTYFAQAREYMPEAGRFAGRDIVKGFIQQPLTLNNYHYCYNNPNKYVDWDGRDAIYMTDDNGSWGMFGHTSILVQDETGKWHHVNFGPGEGGKNSKGVLTVEPIEKNASYGKITIDEVNGTMKSNTVYSKDAIDKNSHQSRGLERYVDQRKDDVIYLKGDYTNSFKKANEYKENQPNYNFFGCNCEWISIEIIAESYPEGSKTRMALEEILWSYGYDPQTGLVRYRNTLEPN